jgi:hypothetical protein
MKVGDMVRLVTQHKWSTAMIVTTDDASGWFWVIDADGRTALWPESQMELLAELP